MASSADYVAYVVERIAGAGTIRTRRMFGEYAVYVDDVVVGFVCDDQLFVKITDDGLALLADSGVVAERGPCYPGSKDYLIVTFLGDDEELARDIVCTTAAALPRSAPTKRRP